MRRSLCTWTALLWIASQAGAAGLVETKSVATTAEGPGAVAVDAQNRIHVTWESVDHKLHHTVFDGRRKTDEVVDAQPECGAASSLAIDSAGHPHVAYVALRGQEYRLAYAEFDGTSWHTEEIGPGGGVPALALDADDQPHIAQQVLPGVSAYFEVVHRDESGWQHEMIEDVNALTSHATSLALDAQGHTHLATNGSGPSPALYATNASGDWVQTTLGEGGPPVELGSLALDSLGRPHLGLFTTNPTTVRYSHFDGAEWQSEDLYDPNDLMPNTTETLRSVSLALDAHDRPAIAFMDQFAIPTQNRVADVVVYAYKRGPTWVAVGVGQKRSFEHWTQIAPAPDGSNVVLFAQTRAQMGSQTLRVARIGIPDLSATWTSLGVTVRGQISTIRGDLEVTNLGATKSASPPLTFFLSSDPILDDQDLTIGFGKGAGAIVPGRSRMVKVSLKALIPVTGKYLIAVVDSAGRFHDQDPANNLASGLMTAP